MSRFSSHTPSIELNDQSHTIIDPDTTAIIKDIVIEYFPKSKLNMHQQGERHIAEKSIAWNGGHYMAELILTHLVQPHGADSYITLVSSSQTEDETIGDILDVSYVNFSNRHFFTTAIQRDSQDKAENRNFESFITQNTLLSESGVHNSTDADLQKVLFLMDEFDGYAQDYFTSHKRTPVFMPIIRRLFSRK